MAALARDLGEIAALFARDHVRMGLDDQPRVRLVLLGGFQHDAERLSIRETEIDRGIAGGLVNEEDVALVAREEQAEITLRRGVVLAEAEGPECLPAAFGASEQFARLPAALFQGLFQPRRPRRIVVDADRVNDQAQRRIVVNAQAIGA